MHMEPSELQFQNLLMTLSQEPGHWSIQDTPRSVPMRLVSWVQGEGPNKRRAKRGQRMLERAARPPSRPLLAQSCPTLLRPHRLQPTSLLCHGIFQARILEWIAIPFSRGSLNPGIEPGSPTLQADSSLSEPSGKPIKKGDTSTCIIDPLCQPAETN